MWGEHRWKRNTRASGWAARWPHARYHYGAAPPKVATYSVQVSDGEKTGLIVGGVALGVVAIGALAYFAMKK